MYYRSTSDYEDEFDNQEFDSFVKIPHKKAIKKDKNMNKKNHSRTRDKIVVTDDSEDSFWSFFD